MANQTGRSSQVSARCGAQDLHPAGEPAPNNQVLAGSIFKEVSKQRLKQGGWRRGRKGGGVAACYGALQLQSAHPYLVALVARVSSAIPGQ